LKAAPLATFAGKAGMPAGTPGALSAETGTLDALPCQFEAG
jgi:hypothetical protein